MRPTASHLIRTLTENVIVSQSEARIWTKLMLNAANSKLKFTESKAKVLLLSKMRSKELGTKDIEAYVDRMKMGEEMKRMMRKMMMKMMRKIRKIMTI